MKYIYILSDRHNYETFDKRQQKLSAPKVIEFYSVNGDDIRVVQTALYQPSKIKYLVNLKVYLPQGNKVSADNLEKAIKFAKKNDGCIYQQFDSIDSMLDFLNTDSHKESFNKMRDSQQAIYRYIGSLKQTELSSRKRSYKNHLLANTGSYEDQFMLINDMDRADIKFEMCNSGEVKLNTLDSAYYSASGFLTYSGTFNTTNNSYSLYRVTKKQQAELKALVTRSNKLFKEASNSVVESFKQYVTLNS